MVFYSSTLVFYIHVCLLSPFSISHVTDAGQMLEKLSTWKDHKKFLLEMVVSTRYVLKKYIYLREISFA